MEIEIRPEPTREERDAILAALRQEQVDDPDPRGAWWRVGVQETLTEPGGRAGSLLLGERSSERVMPARQHPLGIRLR
jgi:hypothetical protein